MLPGESIVMVDMPAVALMEVRARLREVFDNVPVQWSAPDRSPGSSKDCPRLVAAGALTQLDLQLLLRCVWERHLPARCFVAQGNIFADNSPLLVDLSAPEALADVSHLVEEAAFVSPRLAIVRTAARPEVWGA